MIGGILAELFEDFGGAGAFFTMGENLLDHFIHLTADILFKLVLGEGEVVILLKRTHHTTEVLANIGLDQLFAGISLALVLRLHDLVGEVGTCFECKFLGEHESIVAVEEEVFDLNQLVRYL